MTTQCAEGKWPHRAQPCEAASENADDDEDDRERLHFIRAGKSWPQRIFSRRASLGAFFTVGRHAFLPNVKDEPRRELARGVRQHDS